MSEIYFFTTTGTPRLRDAGGKGLSLIEMTRAGFPVPGGFVLSVDFFTPQLKEIKATPAWKSFVESPFNNIKEKCGEIKRCCKELVFTSSQKKTLNDALESLKSITGTRQKSQHHGRRFFAVRSSSPEEDLAGASFAGGYETSLGVAEEDIEQAVITSFTSVFDERVVLYKKEHNFAVDNPGIAVIVQAQVNSEKAGVAFSLNPLNNCYDEALITANYGLGESVVAGIVTPDTFIINKTDTSIIEKRIGKKETAVWLAGQGGTLEKAPFSHEKFCLADDEICELIRMIVRVEDHYKIPVDIEWAYAEKKLYLLQARPVTAYVPLPDELLTLPGEQKFLYVDATLQDVHDALSVTGTDCFKTAQHFLVPAMLGSKTVFGAKEGLFVTTGGRSYANISHNIKIFGKKQLLNGLRGQDSLAADIIEMGDLREYIPGKLPKQLKGVLLKIIKKNISTVRKMFKAYKKPHEYYPVFCEEKERLWKELKEIKEEDVLLREYMNTICKKVFGFVSTVCLPLNYAAELARSRLKKMFTKFPGDVRERVVYLERSLPNNVTVDMGLALCRLAEFDEIQQCGSASEFIEKLTSRTFDSQLLAAWDHFIEYYGFRCPKELDIASPRYYEEPDKIFRQLTSISRTNGTDMSPVKIFEKGEKERGDACEYLTRMLKGKGKQKKLKKNYDILVRFGGYRELPKYFIIKIVEMARRKALMIANTLVEAGRLKKADDIFYLTIDDIDKAVSVPDCDVNALIKENTRFYKRISSIRRFPHLIDSRGKILQPPKKEMENADLAGESISPGIVKGKVKILTQPDEKPVLPGEILVARTTDPGWTPLFLNAAGIILEVGGVLQHGALVAREYAKPCIASVVNATHILKDGQEIEMDGSTGAIRFLT